MKTVAILALSILVYSNSWAFYGGIRISPKVPDDIAGGAQHASLTKAARFAWQEFIALHWPADTTGGKRDVPDVSKKFGDPNFDGPLVWHTYRHKDEVYPGIGAPNGYDVTKADFGYNTLPPVYTYGEGFGGGTGKVPACPGQDPVPPEDTAFINLDEVSQIGLDYMFSGNAPVSILDNKNQFPQLFRFLAQGNQTYYEYAVDPNALPNTGVPEPIYTHPTPCPTDSTDTGYNHPFCIAQRNFRSVSQANPSRPAVLPGPVVDFPAGTILVKGAFRELTEAEMDSGRFYTTTVRYYGDDDEDDADPNTGEICYRQAVWGLAALHIIAKTPTSDNFVFATFEYAHNLLTENGQPVENKSGRVVNKGGETISTTPPLTYADGTPPTLDIVGGVYCEDPGKRLYYLEIEENNPGLPGGGYICQNFRDRSIPAPIRWVNASAHWSIYRYNRRNGISDSPGLNYKLVNVQTKPFDESQVRHHRSYSTRSDAVYNLANIVVETDYTLQRFMGQIGDGGPPTDLPANFDNFNGRQTYQNVLTFRGDWLHKTANMGGCMGCHGVAQNLGADFSFTANKGRVMEPEAPEITEPGTSNPAPVFSP